MPWVLRVNIAVNIIVTFFMHLFFSEHVIVMGAIKVLKVVESFIEVDF